MATSLGLTWCSIGETRNRQALQLIRPKPLPKLPQDTYVPSWFNAKQQATRWAENHPRRAPLDQVAEQHLANHPAARRARELGEALEPRARALEFYHVDAIRIQPALATKYVGECAAPRYQLKPILPRHAPTEVNADHRLLRWKNMAARLRECLLLAQCRAQHNGQLKRVAT
jgi:hypothetical protein